MKSGTVAALAVVGVGGLAAYLLLNNRNTAVAGSGGGIIPDLSGLLDFSGLIPRIDLSGLIPDTSRIITQFIPQTDGNPLQVLLDAGQGIVDAPRQLGESLGGGLAMTGYGAQLLGQGVGTGIGNVLAMPGKTYLDAIAQMRQTEPARAMQEFLGTLFGSLDLPSYAGYAVARPASAPTGNVLADIAGIVSSEPVKAVASAL